MKTVLTAAVLFPMTFYFISWGLNTIIPKQKIHLKQVHETKYDEYCDSLSYSGFEETLCTYLYEK